MERIRVLDAADMVPEHAGYPPHVELHPEMPTGPYNRVADNALARRLLGWEPRTPFVEGLRKTADWYFSTKDPDSVRASLGDILAGRGVHTAARVQDARLTHSG